jgi:hypothetical protein
VIVTPERAKQLESRLTTGPGCIPVDPDAGPEPREQVRKLRASCVIDPDARRELEEWLRKARAELAGLKK